MPYAARPGSQYVIGRVEQYGQETHHNSDLIVLADARDGNGNSVGDLVFGARDVLPLPDGSALAAYDARIAAYLGDAFDPTNLGMVVYGRIVRSWDVSTNLRRTSGVELEVMYVTSLAIPNKPNVGDVVVAYPDHLYREREDYAFVRLALPDRARFDHGFYGVVVV